MLMYGKCECFVMQMYVCVLCASCGSSQCCSLLVLVEDARATICNRHTSRSHNGIVVTGLSVSCLPHPVAVNVFMICRGLCACTEMLWMCVLYVSFGSKGRPRTIGCIAMDSALLFILRFIYSARSGVNRVQVVLSGFSMRLFCVVQAKTVCRYGCMYFLAALVLVCVDVMVMLSA